MKVCVPYSQSDVGARLLAACSGQAWLTHEALDTLASAWDMSRPGVTELPEDATLDSVMHMADTYGLCDPDKLLEEGFVVHLTCLPVADVLRLKVHTHVWNTVHGWWDNNQKSASRVSVGSVMPVLKDERFANAGVEAFERCLTKYRHSFETDAHVPDLRVALRFREAVHRARACLAEYWRWLGLLLARTASTPAGKTLAKAVDDLRETPEFSNLVKSQFDSLRVCVVTIRSVPDCGLREPLDDELIETFLGEAWAAHSLAAMVTKPKADSEAPINERLREVLAHQVIRSSLDKGLGAWAAHAQALWDQEVQKGPQCQMEQPP